MTIVYFAGSDNLSFLKILNSVGIENFLWAYPSSKSNIQTLLKQTKGNPVMMDSGAFSMWSKGEKIDIHKYILFLKKYKKYFETYVNLDSINDAKKTLENQKIMEKAGLKPLPVYHEKEPLDYLREYCKKYDYVGVGAHAKTNVTPKA